MGNAGHIEVDVDAVQQRTADPFLADREYQVPYSVIYQDGRAATKRLRALFDGRDIFDHPKDEQILRGLLEFTTDPDSTVLDFFAGSGSTGHAVQQLNVEDAQYGTEQERASGDGRCNGGRGKQIQVGVLRLLHYDVDFRGRAAQRGFEEEDREEEARVEPAEQQGDEAGGGDDNCAGQWGYCRNLARLASSPSRAVYRQQRHWIRHACRGQALFESL